jgi:hypothetical protein
MLTATDRELICTAVDGELTPDEQRAFQSLIAKNPEANPLFAALCQDRDAIAQRPRRIAPATLHASIMARLQPVTPKQPQPTPTPSRWLPLGMAASFLLAVGTGTYWLASPSGITPNQVSSKQLLELPKAETVTLPTPERMAKVERPVVDPALPAELPETNVPTTPEAVVQKPQETEKPETVPTPPANVLAAPVGVDAKPFERHLVKLPLLLPFAKLGVSDGQESFRTQFTPEVGNRLDLFVKDAPKALELLTQAGRTINLNLTTETIASERLKRKMPSTWLIYTDSLTVDDVTKWMKATQELDAKSPTFASLHLVSVGANDQKELLSMVGVDLGAKKAKPTEPSRHISANTLNQVTQSMQKGDAAKPAILLTYLPPTVRVHPALSRDIKQFHESRKDRPSNAAPLMLVIRTQN